MFIIKKRVRKEKIPLKRKEGLIYMKLTYKTLVVLMLLSALMLFLIPLIVMI